MPKVYHLLPEGEAFSEFEGGAISRWVANVLREDRSGVVVAVSIDHSWRYPAAALVVVPLLRAYRALLQLTRQRTPWVLRKMILRLAYLSTMRKLRPGDTVWVHNRADIAAALARSVHRAGARLVLHMHNAHLLTESRRILAELDADRVVFVSHYLEEASRAMLAPNVATEVLYNGADGVLFTPPSPRVFTRPGGMRVLFASRLVEDKGPHILAAALWELHREGVAVEGVIVGGAQFGDAPPSEYVLELMRKAPPNLRFVPYCSGRQLAELFHDSDVFCLPSVWHDPFPLAPLEAMAAGLPVVATRSGGIPEALSDGGGILIERNSVDALSDALTELSRDPGLRERLSHEAFSSFVRNFRWEHVRAHYNSIVGGLHLA